MTAGFRTSGGEGGIRTLGTGVSPYNGLANGSFSPPSLVFKGLQSDSGPPSRAQGLSFGSYCAPLCAPLCAPRLHFYLLVVGLRASKSGSGPLIRQLLCSALCSTLRAAIALLSARHALWRF